MKFKTKLWRRSLSSFATTVPQVAIISLDENKEYDVSWEYDKDNDLWKVRFEDSDDNSKAKKTKK